jgi:hypothetical protein
MAFKSPANTDEVNWDGRQLMLHYHDPEAGPEVLVLINMDRGAAIDFTLPEGRSWHRRIDTQAYFDSGYITETGADPRRSHNASAPGDVVPTPVYGVQPSSIVILVAE